MSKQTATFTNAHADTKKAWANLLLKLRWQLRRYIKQQRKLSDLRHKLKDNLAEEEAKTFKNQLRIASLRGAIRELDSILSEIKESIARCGGLLFEALPQYEACGATDHDLAQLINCNARKMERIRADFNEMDTQGHSFFTDAIFIFHAENPLEREKEDFVIFSDLPFFDAMTRHFIRTMEVNPKLRQTAHDALDKFFPELRAHQYIVTEGPGGEISLEEYYPPLKLVKSVLREE